MDIEAEIRTIQERNKRVEADKAWETSAFRIVVLAILIYIFAALFLYVSDVQNPILGALIPPVGFIISVQSLPFLKKFWRETIWKGK